MNLDEVFLEFLPYYKGDFWLSSVEALKIGDFWENEGLIFVIFKFSENLVLIEFAEICRS